MSTLNKKLNIVRFAPRNGEGFYEVLKHKIDAYFKDNNLEAHANNKMRWKTVFMVSLYFVPYAFMLTGLAADSLVAYFALWSLMGLGMVGIGCSVMHDSNHGSYSNNKHVNNLLGGLINLVGGYHVTWKIQHNILHHTYTNIEGLDDDIEAGIFLRFSPHAKKIGIHRFQHFYAWFLYCLLTLQWATIKDYRLLVDYNKKDLLKKQKTTLSKSLLEVTGIRIFYFAYVLVLPMLISGVSWEIALMGFLLMHFIAGFSLSTIFQLAHVMESSEYPDPPESRKMENNWAVHQLLNTTNFAPRGRFFGWFIGGLNHQVEHHLFPHICHVHYPKLAHIVKETAEEHGLPYNVQPTFAHAVWYHGKMLRKLGRD